MTRLFLDTNVPMYAAGGDHPLKEPCVRVLRLVIANPSAFVSDAEVLREILHRHLAINRREEGRQLVSQFARLMGNRVESIDAADVVVAAESARTLPGLSARDLLHFAVMKRLQVTQVISTDKGFDGIREVQRMDPALVDDWKATQGLN